MKQRTAAPERALAGFGRTPSEQVSENLRQALRALDLAPVGDVDLMPHPLVIVRAEIENARRYLRLLNEQYAPHSPPETNSSSMAA